MPKLFHRFAWHVVWLHVFLKKSAQPTATREYQALCVKVLPKFMSTGGSRKNSFRSNWARSLCLLEMRLREAIITGIGKLPICKILKLILCKVIVQVTVITYCR